jgi:monofunctional biosynthetic peptidoglycan transglycosylase
MAGRRKRTSGWWRGLQRSVLRLLLISVLLSVGLVASFRWIDPPVSAVMLKRLVDEGGPQRQHWVDLEDIQPAMALAVVAAEDQRFPNHWGFDTEQILVAVEQHLDGGRLRGASTISQQVARNLFLWQGRSVLRKTLEIWFTGLIEAMWPKRRILEMYLNFAETDRRAFGVAVASERYFGVSAAELSVDQSALIAAVLPNPVRYRIDDPSEYVRKRQAWILSQMRNLGGPAYLRGIL